MATSERLSDERVREIAALPTPVYNTTVALAREVLALREEGYAKRFSVEDQLAATKEILTATEARLAAVQSELDEANAVLAKGNDGFVRQVQQFAEWKAKGDALIATLTAQRDEAVAIAREAVQGWLDKFPGVEGESKFDEVAARLAQWNERVAAVRNHPDYKAGE